MGNVRRHGDRQGSRRRDGWVRRHGDRKTSRCETGEVTEGQTGWLEDGVKGKMRRNRDKACQETGDGKTRQEVKETDRWGFCDDHRSLVTSH